MQFPLSITTRGDTDHRSDAVAIMAEAELGPFSAYGFPEFSASSSTPRAGRSYASGPLRGSGLAFGDRATGSRSLNRPARSSSSGAILSEPPRATDLLIPSDLPLSKMGERNAL